ncbi:MAG: 30S ribosomal protein S4 [Actinomycetota bacterium]|nr:30S ribosomal protein S4 [Actinomycetota bacterium]
MARYISPLCKICRRENEKLFLKGERCLTDKCAMERRPYPPGEHGRRRPKETEYSLQLREKQKAKRIYGILENQFKRYYDLAAGRRGITGENLLRLLELRMDNVVYRLGFAASRNEARQMVRHGHFMVNGRKVNIPSYQVKLGDVISVCEGREIARIRECVQSSTKPLVPGWLEVDIENLKGKVLSLPERDQIDIPVNEKLIVELYSK